MNKTMWATLIALAIICAFGGRAATQEPDAEKARRVPYYYGAPPYGPGTSYNPSRITIYDRGYYGYLPYSRYPVYVTPPVYYQRHVYVPLNGWAPGGVYPNNYANPAWAGYYGFRR